MVYRIGIDGGGTKTLGVLINEKGQILGQKEAGPANFLTVGLDQAIKNIEAVIYGLCKEHNLSLNDVKIGMGLAGVGREKDKKILTEALSGRNFDSVIETDAVAALMAATEGKDGIIVAAGTGSIAYGIRGGKQVRVGGWGYLLGDEGSGYYIGKRAMMEACRSYDGRSKHSLLHEIVLDYFACINHDDFISFIYEQPPLRQQVADLTRKVADVANKKQDSLAIQILEDAASELAQLAITAAKRLDYQDEEFALGFVGGVFRAGDHIEKPFREKVLEVFPKAKIEPCLHHPAV
ncbi:MAG: BadF/BadG/BcrA/BcrD ATPase family protein, partial [Firmicutes bacterium]|nr:BadF/BadG/BcrA/BcrD ATPase family protein [Bacillota bacterium]